MLPGRIAALADGGVAVERPTSAGELSGTVRLVERLGSLSLVHVDLDHGEHKDRPTHRRFITA